MFSKHSSMLTMREFMLVMFDWTIVKLRLMLAIDAWAPLQHKLRLLTLRASADVVVVSEVVDWVSEAMLVRAPVTVACSEETVPCSADTEVDTAAVLCCASVMPADAALLDAAMAADNVAWVVESDAVVARSARLELACDCTVEMAAAFELEEVAIAVDKLLCTELTVEVVARSVKLALTLVCRVERLVAAALDEVTTAVESAAWVAVREEVDASKTRLELTWV